MTMIDFLAEEVGRISKAAFNDVQERTAQKGTDALLRRFRSLYGRLSMDEITAIQEALGHQDGEDPPCKACKVMAQEEYKRTED